MTMIKKEVKYLNKDFAQFRQNLINFTKTYFPNTYQDFNESSPGMMFMEMASYVGDVLSYYTDTSYRESILSTAEESSNVIMLSQLFGYKPRLNSPATCKLDIFQLVPAINSGADAKPDMRYALTIKPGMIVTSEAGKRFHTQENIDFNQDPEITVYEIDGAGNVSRYLLKKTVDVLSGEVKTLEFEFGDPKPYDKIILPEDNVIDILSVRDSRDNSWRQVDYLAQDTVFEDIPNIPFNDPELSQFRSTVPYILKLRRTPRRYVCRVRDDKRLEIQFGSGVSSDADEEIIPNPKNVGHGLEYLRRTTNSNIDPTNFLSTSTYGLVPSNTTIIVKYSFGGDIDENVGVGELETIDEVEYGDDIHGVGLEDTITTVAISNPEAATGGSGRQDLDEIRQNAIATFAAQNRAITREDYIARCYAMPTRFGSIAKAFIIGDTQQNTEDRTFPRETIENPMALNLYTLGYDANGKLVELNQALKENLRTYLSNFRMLTDAINIKKAHIINIGVEFEVIPKPRFNSNEVLLQCIDRLKTLMHSERMQINAPINIAQVISDLDRLEGVESIPELKITNLAGGLYSPNRYIIRRAIKNNILYPSLDPSIFEVKFPNRDIEGRVVKP